MAVGVNHSVVMVGSSSWALVDGMHASASRLAERGRSDFILVVD